MGGRLNTAVNRFATYSPYAAKFFPVDVGSRYLAEDADVSSEGSSMNITMFTVAGPLTRPRASGSIVLARV